MKPRLSIDTIAIGVLLTFAIIAGAIIWIGESVGVQVRVDLPDGGIVGPWFPRHAGGDAAAGQLAPPDRRHRREPTAARLRPADRDAR